MKKTKRIAAMLLALTMLLLLLAGCGEEEKKLLQLRIATMDTPNTLDPAMVDADAEKTVVVHLFENLMKLTKNGVVCAQAKSYTCTDNLDGTETYRFYLRGDIKWSDGKAVTAQDFVYAWQRLVAPETESPNRELLNMIAGYEEAINGNLDALQVWAEDMLTLVVVLNCHCPYFLSSICTSAATMPVRADAVEKDDWSMNRATLITNGVYQVSTWADTVMSLSMLENYYDAKSVGVQKLEFHFGMAYDVAMAAYEKGEMDIVMESSQTETSLRSYRPAVKVLLINQMASRLKKEELRQALSLVLDRSAICTALGGNYIPADGLIPYGTASTNGGDFRVLNGAVIDNTPENYEAKCASALELLKTAGYTSAILENLGTVTLLYANIPQQIVVAESLQKMWQEKLGLSVTLKAVSNEDMQNALKTGEFTMALIDITSDRNDASAYLKRFCSDSSENYGMYYSNAYDLLMRVIESANNVTARDAYMEDAEKLLLESGYVIPLFNDTHNWLVRDGLVGALDNGQDAHYFAYVHEADE